MRALRICGCWLFRVTGVLLLLLAGLGGLLGGCSAYSTSQNRDDLAAGRAQLDRQRTWSQPAFGEPSAESQALDRVFTDTQGALETVNEGNSLAAWIILGTSVVLALIGAAAWGLGSWIKPV